VGLELVTIYQWVVIDSDILVSYLVHSCQIVLAQCKFGLHLLTLSPSLIKFYLGVSSLLSNYKTKCIRMLW
jgi:hypothetical protein